MTSVSICNKCAYVERIFIDYEDDCDTSEVLCLCKVKKEMMK